MPPQNVRALIEEFASRIESVIKQELRDAIDHVGLGAASGPRRSAAAPVAKNGHRGSRGKGAKRDSAALEALAERFVTFVSKHPGLRIEQINKQLGTTTKDLALPIRKLIADGAIQAHGQKRSTTYTVSARKRAKR